MLVEGFAGCVLASTSFTSASIRASGVESARSAILRLNLFDRLQYPLAVERLQQIVHRIHLERAHRILVERRGKYYMRQLHLFIQQLLQYREAIQPGHLHVEEHHIRLVRADQFHRLDPIRSLGQNLHALGGLQKVKQLLPA